MNTINENFLDEKTKNRIIAAFDKVEIVEMGSKNKKLELCFPHHALTDILYDNAIAHDFVFGDESETSKGNTIEINGNTYVTCKSVAEKLGQMKSEHFKPRVDNHVSYALQAFVPLALKFKGEV
jgi:hypothetical protein